MEPAILFTTPPNLDELCGITVLVKLSIQSPTAQAHVIKCREMIFTEPELIASPSCDIDDCFNIIMLQSHFKSGKVQTRLQKQGLQISKPYRILPSLYQSCLHYTLLARLAPTWNKAGEWLLQGRDFLLHTGYTNAIKMQLCVNKDEMFVSVIGTVIKFPPLQIEDLELSREEMQNIVKPTQDQLCEVTVDERWCHVLPSMKRGRIISLSLNIPRKSPFASYRGLQRHWKNMYGYRLPETDEDLLYCQVSFLPSDRGQHFTYPSICLRPGPLQLIQRVDPKPVLAAFVQDVHSKVGAVCGHALRFQPKMCFAYPSLHAATADQNKGRISLSSHPVNRSTAPLRNQRSIASLCSAMNMEKKVTVREKLCEEKGMMGTEKTTEILAEEARQLTLVTNKSNTQMNTGGSLCNDPANGPRMLITRDNNTNSTMSKWHAGQEYRADKTNNLFSNHTDGLLDQQHSSLPQTQPMRRPLDQQHSSLPQTQPMRWPLEEHNKSLQSVTASKFIPRFKPTQKHQADSTCSHSADLKCKDSNQNTFVPVFKPHVSKVNVSTSNPHKAAKAHEISDVKNKSLLVTEKPLISAHPSAGVSVPYFRKQSKNKGVRPLSDHRQETSIQNHSANSNMKLPAVKAVQQNPRTFPALSPRQCETKCGNSLLTPDSAAMTFIYKPSVASKVSPVKSLKSADGGAREWAQSDLKRKKLTEGEDTPKKSRAKPQIKQDLDVESLARVNQLGKVNAVTLTAWLKDRGVVCRSKDKKTDLVDKVNNYLLSAKQGQ